MNNKNMKRLGALSLSAMMLMANVSSIDAFAADLSVSDKANVIFENEIIKGDEHGIDPTETFERYRAFVMLNRLLGNEADFTGFSYTDGAPVFNDSEGVSDYVLKLMAYLKANPELGVNGDEFGNLNPYDMITGKEYVKVVLVALGYEYNVDFTWNTALDFAKSIGLIESVDGLNSSVTLESIAAMTYDGLTTEMKDGSASMGDKLGYDIVAEDVAVQSIVSIDNTSIEVTINALTEDMLGATIEVVDNNGVLVPVKPVDIAAGDTSVFFEFASAVTTQEGTWIIDGVSYNFDLMADLAAFESASSQIEINNALTELNIKNVIVANIPAYIDAKDAFLTGLKSPLSVELIQGFVDNVNSSQISSEESAAIAKPVNDAITADNDVALLQALQNSAFVRVNAEWLSDYKDAISDEVDATKKDSVVEIQDLVNSVNNIQVTTAIATIANNINKTTLATAKSTITNYSTPKADGTQEDATKNALKAVDVQVAIADVLAATTPTTLKSKLTVLAGLVNDKATLDIAVYLDANAKAYITALDANPTTVAGVKTALTDANDTANEALVDSVDDAAAGTDADVLLAAIKALGLKNVIDANKAQYLVDKDAFATAADKTNVTTSLINIQKQIDASNDVVVEAANLKSVNEATAAAAVHSVLLSLNDTDYLDVPSVDRIFVAQFVYASKPDGGYAVFDAVVDAMDEGITARTDALSDVNAIDESTLNTAAAADLKAVGNTSFNDMTAVAQADVAELFIAGLKKDSNGDIIAYKNIAEVNTAINSAITAYNAK